MGNSEVFNAQEAADFLGAHVQTIRKLARAGKIPCFKVGKDWRFRREALLRWAEGQQTSEQRGEDAPASEGGGRSILVIDDDMRVRWSTKMILKRMGCQVREAASGTEGLELIAEEAPDAILLDLIMPEMTGPEFLKLLRESYPSLPVVIITGHPDSDLVSQAMEHAPILMLAKPLDPELLGRTVQTLVGERAQAPR